MVRRHFIHDRWVLAYEHNIDKDITSNRQANYLNKIVLLALVYACT